jgi:hypothetical protein
LGLKCKKRILDNPFSKASSSKTKLLFAGIKTLIRHEVYENAEKS